MAIFKIQTGETLLKVRQRPRSQIKDTWRLSKGVNKTKGRGAHYNHQGCWGQSMPAKNATAGHSIASGPGADASIV